MNTYRFAVCLLTAAGFTACQSTATKDPLQAEAARYHEQATAIQATLEPQLDRIDSLKTALKARKTPAGQATAQTLDSLKKAFETWETNLVEVPGMHHEHHHEHGKHEHHHADATFKDLPADQMRDLQREILASIRQIQARYNEMANATGH